ncbi:tetratricopeptide repeat protein [Myxococcota bacterium]|nr:tetratricopeptide repeat protein [Myxococcota bacterium]
MTPTTEPSTPHLWPLIPTRALLAALLALALPAGAVAEARAAGPCQGATLTKGQRRIDQGRYAEAVTIFTCVLEQDPLSLDALRGRAEAQLRRGRFSDAMRDYARITAVVMPVHPDAAELVLASYDARLARHPDDLAALSGAVFAHWWYFDYPTTLPWAERILELSPDDLFGTLYRGSNRLFTGDDVSGGIADLERAIQLAPASADVRFIVADAYTYAYPDPVRARSEALLALAWGLDTPRVHAILASAAFALGEPATGALHVQRHIELVTTQLVPTAPLAAGETMALDLVAGRTYEIPIELVEGEALSIRTTSPSGAIWDSIAVLLGPGGAPAIGNDDLVDYFAGFDWVAPASGIYTLRLTTFEGVAAGDLTVTRS